MKYSDDTASCSTGIRLCDTDVSMTPRVGRDDAATIATDGWVLRSWRIAARRFSVSIETLSVSLVRTPDHASRRRRHLAERWPRRSGGAPMRRPGRRSGSPCAARTRIPRHFAAHGPHHVETWPAAPVRARRTPWTRRAATRNVRTRQSAAGAARFNRLTAWTNSGGIVVIAAESAPRETAARRQEHPPPRAQAGGSR